MAPLNDSEVAKLPLVPEAVLKRKHDMDEMKAHRAAQQLSNPRGNRKVFSSKTKSFKIRKPEKFVARAMEKRNHTIRFKRVMKKGMQARASNKTIIKTKLVQKDKNVQDEDAIVSEADGGADVVEVKYAANSVGASLVFVVRIRDGSGTPPPVQKLLNQMRLQRINEGVFLQYNDQTRKNLHLVEPWVSYGIPSKAMVSDLINRRGHGRVEGKRIPISDNTVIERALGEKTGIICVEDLVHEIVSVSPSFQAANSFLWPFLLTAPRTKFQKDKLNFKDGGDYGDRGEEMDDLIRKML
jgi:large subunit ribosomal protein L7e